MKLSQKMSNKRARCLLCPRYCELSEDDIGKCRARSNQEGQILPYAYGAISSIATEPIEKKPFKHFMPGTRTLSIGGFGCNLECKYCENCSISQSDPPEDHFYSPKDIVSMACYFDSVKSVCMTYNEPTIAFEYLIKLANLCHENDLKFIIKTNAYINREPWKEVCKVVDAMNIDMKGIGDTFEEITNCRYVGGYCRKIMSALVYSSHVEISIPVYANTELDLQIFGENMKMFGYDVPIHLLKVNPAHLMINERVTSDEEIEDARKLLSHFFTDIYV